MPPVNCGWIRLLQDCEINIRFFAPPEDLAPCFTTFYRLEVDMAQGSHVVDYLHPEWANLRFFKYNPPSAQIGDDSSVAGKRFQATGPSSLPTRFELGRTRMWGIGLLPLGWARFVGVDASEHVNTICDGEEEQTFVRFSPLCNVLCREGDDDESEFSEIVAFFRQLAPPPRDEKRILTIHDALIDPALMDVEEFADRCGLSKRTLERACARHFGFSPRLLLRRQRMMRSLAAFMLGERTNWSQVIDSHYHDQAHFVHEFHAFMGMSPSEYASIPHPILSAFVAERQRVWGSPVQTLDKPKSQSAGKKSGTP